MPKDRFFSIFFAVSILSASLPSKILADTVHLQSGQDIEGIVQSEESGRVKLKVNSGVVTFSRADVVRIDRSTAEERAAILAKWEAERAEAEARERSEKAEAAEKKAREEFEPKAAKVYGSDGRVYVDVLLNKKVRATMALDTGCSTMLLTHEVAKKLKLKLKNAPVGVAQVADGRKITARRVYLDSVKVEDSEARGVEASVLMPGGPKTEFKDGLLGMSYLKNFAFKVDYKRKKLTLEKIR